MIPVATTSAAPRIGVLINNYNNGPWLRACVDSVLAQTRPADEIVVYDDGSTDDSVAVLRSYGDRIRLLEGVHDFVRPGMHSQGHAVAAAFAASNGALATRAFIEAPAARGVAAAERGLVGQLASLFLNGGIVTGSNAALAFAGLP